MGASLLSAPKHIALTARYALGREAMASLRIASRISRRGFVGALSVFGGAVALAACGGTAPPTEAPKPAAAATQAPAAAAPANTPVPAAAGAAAPPPQAAAAPPPTATFVPTATPVPYTGGDNVLPRAHWSGVQFNDCAEPIHEYDPTH